MGGREGLVLGWGRRGAGVSAAGQEGAGDERVSADRDAADGGRGVVPAAHGRTHAGAELAGVYYVRGAIFQGLDRSGIARQAVVRELIEGRGCRPAPLFFLERQFQPELYDPGVPRAGDPAQARIAELLAGRIPVGVIDGIEKLRAELRLHLLADEGEVLASG